MTCRKVDVKVVLLGREYGGKTSLVERYLHGRFEDERPYQNTIGAAYGAKTIHVFGRDLTLGIFDTAGSERYQAMSRIYYRDAWAAILCCDLTDRTSFERAKFWLNELQCNEPNCHVYFVGTKKDLVEPSKCHEFCAAAERLGGSNALIFETSSKTGANVNEVFERIAKDYIKEIRERGPPGRNNDDQRLSLAASLQNRGQKSKRKNNCNC